MQELERVRADAKAGERATRGRRDDGTGGRCNVALAFQERIAFDGVVLTKLWRCAPVLPPCR